MGVQGARKGKKCGRRGVRMRERCESAGTLQEGERRQALGRKRIEEAKPPQRSTGPHTRPIPLRPPPPPAHAHGSLTAPRRRGDAHSVSPHISLSLSFSRSVRIFFSLE